MKTDIKNRADIEQLVNAFYFKIKADDAISYFFIEVANVNWETHLPKVCDFFENILFSTGDYDGNPMIIHRELNKKSAVSPNHFKRWNTLFDSTVDELFVGLKADEIKQRAINISAAMMHKTLS
ncbi:group III truncated hemoglobin [Flavobacterium sp.]|uniref:group III truncated hemoglobin n=1 Tax=Flavobacterium sp. TaxID=239 RepID=UPI0037516265